MRLILRSMTLLNLRFDELLMDLDIMHHLHGLVLELHSHEENGRRGGFLLIHILGHVSFRDFEEEVVVDCLESELFLVRL